MTNATYPDRLAIIRAELEQRARARKTITYGEMAPRLGLMPMALGRLLDTVHDEEKAQGRPDLGCLVVNATTKFPGYVGESESERANALAIREAVFKTWARG